MGFGHRADRSRFVCNRVYLGRFLRFNSWDFITQPDILLTAVVEDLFGKRPVVIMIVTFAVITGLYWLMKQVTLRIMEKII